MRSFVFPQFKGYTAFNATKNTLLINTGVWGEPNGTQRKSIGFVT